MQSSVLVHTQDLKERFGIGLTKVSGVGVLTPLVCLISLHSFVTAFSLPLTPEVLPYSNQNFFFMVLIIVSNCKFICVTICLTFLSSTR